MSGDRKNRLASSKFSLSTQATYSGAKDIRVPPCLQRSFEELRHRRDLGAPVSPQERIVDIIGEHQALDLHALREEPAFEIDGLMKIHGAVVIAVNEQDW